MLSEKKDNNRTTNNNSERENNSSNKTNNKVNSSITITQTNTIINIKNEEKDSKELSSKKKKFAERVGDWICTKCKNLNFSFRVICNRCELSKTENDRLYDQYINNLPNCQNINELFNKQTNYNQNYANYINSQCFNNQSNFVCNNSNIPVNYNIINQPQINNNCYGYNPNLNYNNLQQIFLNNNFQNNQYQKNQGMYYPSRTFNTFQGN